VLRIKRGPSPFQNGWAAGCLPPPFPASHKQLARVIPSFYLYALQIVIEWRALFEHQKLGNPHILGSLWPPISESRSKKTKSMPCEALLGSALLKGIGGRIFWIGI